jgi:ketosteroid isomerase-like protein
MNIMKKKNGINIMLFVFIIILFMNLSCSRASPEKYSGILLKTDRDFANMSLKDGMFSAFLFYIADDGVILRDNSFPSKGKVALMQYFTGKTDTASTLNWEPVYEAIAESGDLGYTYGVWSSTEKLSGQISRGTYVTIWKKQNNGSWKFVLDTGTNGLPTTK